MAGFWNIVKDKDGNVSISDIEACKELFEAATELQIYELSFRICVNMIANAMGRCEFRTFANHEEIRNEEYYLWNVEPNQNQNATAFIHKLITRLYEDNRSLVIENKAGKLIVADSFTESDEHPARANQYKDVTVGDFTYSRPFKEKEVLHFVLNHVNVKPVLQKLQSLYGKIVEAAESYYEWHKGQHWKVKVDSVASGAEDFAKNFAAMINEQFKPFLNSRNAVLPQFAGYEYSNESGNVAIDSTDLRNLTEEAFNFTARALLIPAVLVNGKVEQTADANTRFLTNCIDPLCDQLQEEITRKRYGFEEWKAGNYIKVDSSSIIHFDLFANAANVEKLVGSGAFTINDVLRASNQATINEDWADEHFLTLNITTMKEATRKLGNQEGGSNK